MLGVMGGSFRLTSLCRTLVYLEGDATMRSYEDSEGRKQSQLSLVQTKLEVLKRPFSPAASEGTGEVGPGEAA